MAESERGDMERVLFDRKRYNTWRAGILAAETFCIAGMVDRETAGDRHGLIAASWALVAVNGLDRKPSGRAWVRN